VKTSEFQGWKFAATQLLRTDLVVAEKRADHENNESIRTQRSIQSTVNGSF